jgi:8-oxo-dGTP diphosphatase
MNIVDIYLESLINNNEKVIKKVKVAGAIIIKKGDNDEDMILLIQRAKEDNWPMVWEYPRGKLKKGESNIQGLKREVKEETGLDIEVIKYIDKYTYIADEGKRESTQYNYLCKMKNPNQKIKLSFEHDDYQWVTQFGLIELLCSDEMKKTISRVFNVDTQIVNYPERDEEILE